MAQMPVLVAYYKTNPYKWVVNHCRPPYSLGQTQLMDLYNNKLPSSTCLMALIRAHEWCLRDQLITQRCGEMALYEVIGIVWVTAMELLLLQICRWLKRKTSVRCWIQHSNQINIERAYMLRQERSSRELACATRVTELSFQQLLEYLLVNPIFKTRATPIQPRSLCNRFPLKALPFLWIKCKVISHMMVLK